MRLLLDTHIWLWSLLQPDRLTDHVRQVLTQDDCELWLSSISVWEALVLAEKNRISVDREPRLWVRDALLAAPVNEAPITIEVAIASRTVGLPHQDPADRFIAASAIVHDLTLVTADKRLLACPDVRTVANGKV